MFLQLLMRAALPARGRSFAGVAALSLLLFAGTGHKAFADTVYNLTVGNTAISGFPSPYGTVTVHLNSPTQALITFQGAVTGGNTYKFGGGQAMDVNVNASSFTVGSITENGSGTTSVTSGAANGFGKFNVTIDNSDGATDSFTTGTFIVTNTSATWASDAAVLTSNGAPNNAIVAAHIFVFNAAGVNVATGFASQSGAVDTPEPATILSAAAGLMSMGFFRLRRRRQQTELAA